MMSLGLRFRLSLDQLRLIDRKLAMLDSDAEAFLSPGYKMLETAIADVQLLLEAAETVR
jgi:hypothetical protein